MTELKEKLIGIISPNTNDIRIVTTTEETGYKNSYNGNGNTFPFRQSLDVILEDDYNSKKNRFDRSKEFYTIMKEYISSITVIVERYDNIVRISFLGDTKDKFDKFTKDLFELISEIKNEKHAIRSKTVTKIYSEIVFLKGEKNEG